MSNSDEVKACSKCAVLKPLDEFSKQKAGALGRTSRCKVCKAAENKAYKAANPEKVKTSRAKYKRENAVAISEKSRLFRAANLASINETKKRWRKANRDIENAIKMRHRLKYIDRERAKERAHYEATRKVSPRVELTHEERCARRRATARGYYYRNRLKCIAYGKEWLIAHPEARQKYRRRMVQEASNAYIAGLLYLPVASVPAQLIEAKRTHLKLVRKIKELKR